MMRVGIFQTTNSMYGGSSYELMIADSLSEAHRIEWIPVQPWYRRSHRLQTMLRVAFAERVRCKDLWIRNETSLLGMVSPKLAASTIAIVHHLDDSIGSVKAWSRVLNNHWIRR